jgi:predicted ATPase/class 3 adenylate cyclase
MMGAGDTGGNAGDASMTELPSGTVTFLFTDVEGSTRLWERDPAAMRAAVDRHLAMLDGAVTAHGGVHFKTVGDAIQAAFGDPAAAVAAAVDAQQTLESAAWGETGSLRVRMAVHLGEAEPSGGDYLAPCLNRLARLLAAGHGGQVLLTDAVRRRVEDRLPDGVVIVDLGRHRLRDLLEPEAIAQLAIPGLPVHFPPLATLERHPTNLPVQPTELVGREAELAELQDLLAPEDRPGSVRLVTLTGPGGVGKTRLALQAAADLLSAFADGAFFVDLAPVSEPTLVLPAIAQSLAVREGGAQTLREAVVGYLRQKRLLLVLDNAERVTGAAPVVADLLGACPHLAVIATSRVPLRLRAEREFAVEPLALPDPRRLPGLVNLARVPAVDLFVRRAEAARRGFALTEANARAIAEICVRLDGLPLALELAAARVKLLTPPALLARLSNRLALLTGGAHDLPARQQTLHATIAWSHDLLPPEEQVLFRRLAVFAGGFTLEAAEDVGGEAARRPGGDDDSSFPSPPFVFDGVASLVDKSLLGQTEGADGGSRFAMLETIREFGLARLAEGGEDAVVRDAHAVFFLALAERAEPELTGPDQQRWLDRLEMEHSNLRQALDWMQEHEAGAAVRLAGALWRFWWTRGHLAEGRGRLEAVLERGGGSPAERGKALHGAGSLAGEQGDYDAATAHLEAALAAFRQTGDRLGEALALTDLGLIARDQGALERAEEHHEAALVLRRAVGDRRGVAVSLSNLGGLAMICGDYEGADAAFADAVAAFRALGDRRSLATVVSIQADAATRRGDYGRAIRYAEEAIALLREVGDQSGVAVTLVTLAAGLSAQGEVAEATARYEEARALCHELGHRRCEAAAVTDLALLVLKTGETERACALLKEGLDLLGPDGDRYLVIGTLEFAARAALAVGAAVPAVRLLGATAAQREVIGAPPSPTTAAAHRHLAAEAGAALGEDAFAAAWGAGTALSLAEAFAEATEVMARNC